jgi:hypothetical protein
MHVRHLLVAAALGGGLAAQTFTVAPAPYANQQGNANNPIPFYNTNARYQQIHGGLRGTPRLISAMAVRRGNNTNVNAVARTLDLTVLLADAEFTQTSPTFAANYRSTPTLVFPRAQVNFPDWTVTGGTPEPWSIVIPFVTPHLYVGTTDLLWEWVVENNSSGTTQAYAADVYSGLTGANLDMLNATSTRLGVGCMATGAASAMSYSPRCYTSRSLNSLYFRGTALNGVIGAPSVILLGGTNPNLTFPGLCTTLFVDPLVTFPSVASATGSFTMPDVLVPYDPNWVGARLFSQAVSTDPGQLGLPLALSNGIENVIPAMQPPGVEQVIRLFDTSSATATVGLVNYYAYGLIVRFTH